MRLFKNRAVRYCFYSLATAGLAWHFALTGLFVLPNNPIKTVTAMDRQYIGRYFYQDWGLFAPDPVQRDMLVYVQCVGDNHSTPALDITTGLWESRRRNPFSASDRLSRVHTNYAFALISPGRQETPLIGFCRDNPDEEICTTMETERNERRSNVEEGMTRLASAFCADMRGSFGMDFAQARIWVALADVPRWSQRWVGEKDKDFIDLGTVALEQVPSFGVWR